MSYGFCATGGSGTYNLSGGSLWGTDETIGNSGTATLIQSGTSTNNVPGTLAVALNGGGASSDDLQAGTLDATTIKVGLLGSFKFDGGTASYVTLNPAGGTLDASVPLVNNATINGFGTSTPASSSITAR